MERNKNILSMVRSLSDKSRGQILSKSLKGRMNIYDNKYITFNCFTDSVNQCSSKTVQLATGGSSLTVTVGKETKQSSKFFTADDLRRLQNLRQFSDNDMRFV